MSPFEESWHSASTVVLDKEERKTLFATLDSFRSVSNIPYFSVMYLTLGCHRTASDSSIFLLLTMYDMVMRPMMFSLAHICSTQ